MSVIVKSMEMPKNCGECPFIFTSWGIEYYCHLAESSTSAEYVGREKMTNCPLIELPPHGRLGDLDALYEEISNGNKAYNGIEGYDGEYQHIGDVDDCLDVIKMADAVIEAEGETDA